VVVSFTWGFFPAALASELTVMATAHDNTATSKPFIHQTSLILMFSTVFLLDDDLTHWLLFGCQIPKA
jgi:hypothetical protein